MNLASALDRNVAVGVDATPGRPRVTGTRVVRDRGLYDREVTAIVMDSAACPCLDGPVCRVVGEGTSSDRDLADAVYTPPPESGVTGAKSKVVGDRGLKEAQRRAADIDTTTGASIITPR